MEEKKSTTTAKIYPAIASVMQSVKAIAKAQRNQSQGFNFRGIDDVMNELHGLFAKEGVFILPECLDYEVQEKVTEKPGYNGQPPKRSVTFYTRVKMLFHFVATDGSEVTITNYGEGMDNGDKGMNKAMSIALKYALMQMLLIPTSETKDPDAETYATVGTTADARQYDPMQDVIAQIRAAQTKESLVAIWNNCRAYQTNPRFSQAMTERKKEILK